MKTESYVTKRRIGKTFLQKSKIPLLSGLNIEITERCNNNCVHCYINLPADDLVAKEKELSSIEIKNILKEAVSLGCLTVRFTGGEPFLREDFEELYIFARRLGLKVVLFTNATLVTPRFAELLNRIPPLEKIEVTIYGMKKKSYEASTRTPGSFEAAWRGINLLLKYKIPFVVKSAFLPSNKDEIDEFEAWAKTLPWMDISPSCSMFFDLSCRRDEEKNQLIRSVRVTPDEGVKVFTRREEKYIKEMKEFCSKFMGPSGDKLFSCGSGIGSGCIDAYGIFKPCVMLRHPDCVYDLKKGSLKDALTNFFPKMRQLRVTNPEYLVRCARCFLKGFCGQCPAKSWTEYGTLDTPVEYFCEGAHTKARFLGLLEEWEVAWEVKNWEERVRKFSGKAKKE